MRLFCQLFHTKHLHINGKCHVGFSWIRADNVDLTNCRIGHFNYINLHQYTLRMNGGMIKHLNFINGSFNVSIDEIARICNLNKISYGGNISYHEVNLILKRNSNIVSNCIFDMTDSITIGENTTLAGSQTQIWTHSFLFLIKDHRQVRVDAPVVIGNNCYIGSRCCILSGVTICDNITVGAQTCVSKDLKEQGAYVSAPMRKLDFIPDDRLKKLGRPVYGEFIFRK